MSWNKGFRGHVRLCVHSNVHGSKGRILLVSLSPRQYRICCLLAHHAVSAGKSKAAFSAEGSHALTAVVQSPAFESAAEVSYSTLRAFVPF